MQQWSNPEWQQYPQFCCLKVLVITFLPRKTQRVFGLSTVTPRHTEAAMTQRRGRAQARVACTAAGNHRSHTEHLRKLPSFPFPASQPRPVDGCPPASLMHSNYFDTLVPENKMWKFGWCCTWLFIASAFGRVCFCFVSSLSYRVSIVKITLYSILYMLLHRFLFRSRQKPVRF